MVIKGKAKTLEQAMLMTFRDDITAGNKVKHDIIEGKGAICCQVSQKLFKKLEMGGVKTHYLKLVGMDQMLVKQLYMIPVEVVVRNLAAGSIVKTLGLTKGDIFHEGLVEFYLKNDELGDPLLTEDRIEEAKLIAKEDLDEIKHIARQVNCILKQTFKEAGFTLVDFKLEFGFDAQNNIVLGDEISPDSCRLWKEGLSWDKDIFRQGEYRDLISAYKGVLEAL